MSYRIKIVDQDGKQFWSKRFANIHRALKEAKSWRGLKGSKVKIYDAETGERVG